MSGTSEQEKALTIPCPWCSAPVGQACRDDGLTQATAYDLHPARITRAMCPIPPLRSSLAGPGCRDWRTVARIAGTRLVRDGGWRAAVECGDDSSVSYELADNGGEINVVRVTREIIRSVPSTDRHGAVGDETMGYRLGRALAGEDIDWAFRLED